MPSALSSDQVRWNLVVILTGPAKAASLALYALQAMSILSVANADEEEEYLPRIMMH